MSVFVFQLLGSGRLVGLAAEDGGRRMTSSGKKSSGSGCRSSSTSTSRGVSRALLEQQKYFHGLLPREDIVSILKKDGDFVVRTSYVKDEEKTVVSVWWGGKPLHFVVQETPEKKVYLEKKTFENIVDLITLYMQTKEKLGKNGARLLRPISRQQWQLSHEQINLIHKLGEGEFGEVYKAYLKSGARQDTRFQEVAVKLCRSNPDREQRMKFMHEARLLRAYHHPNIIRFIEYAPNGSLLEYLRKKGFNCSLEERIRFCVEAAQGMEYLEKKTCIHQDLAARNCLLSKTNNIKIADFGLSKQQEFYKLTKRQRLPVKWLAPEVITANLYSIKSDVWAYGILMWEIYSDGQNPYPGMNNQVAAKKVTQERYRMSPPPVMPKKGIEVMLSSWSERPEQRPSFAEIRKVLHKVYKSFK